MKKVALLLICLVSFTAVAENVPGQNLLNYFSSNCKSEGEWTRAALADSTALIESLRSISQDPDCKSVGGAIAQLGILNQQLLELDKTNETQSKIAELNAQEQELLIQISNNTDPDTLASINATLRDLQVQRAGLIGKDKAQSEMSGASKSQMLSGVVQIANTAFTQVTSNQKCLEKNPSVLNTATSVMSAVGATTAIVNPALGLGLTAGSAFLGATIEGVRTHLNNREIRRISDNTIASEAYKCALETMSERWCQMRDAESFLIFKAEQRKFPGGDGLGSAIHLNDREIPVVIEWLNKIRSGVTPTSTADAARQNAVREREGYVQAKEAFGLGLIEETRQVYNEEENETEKWNILRGLIKLLVPNHVDGWKNPLFDAIGSEGYAPFFLLGLPDDAAIKNPQTGAYHTLDTWVKPATFNPSLDLVKMKYIEWIFKARTRVNKELSQVLQPDALQTLSSAFDRTGNRMKVSPMDALKKLIDFLEKNPPSERDFAFMKLYNDTLKKLKDIHSITEDAIVLRDLMGDSNPVEQIYNVAQLRFGTVVLEARLEMIVRLALLELLEKSPPEDQILVAQLLAAERFTDTITKMSGTDNLAMIRADINRAQPMTISNLNTFIDIFGNNINRILGRLKFEELNSTGTVARSKRYARTEMCFLLLAVPNIDPYVDWHNCEGLQMKSLVKDGPESFTISSETFKLDMNDRACEYREFFRKSKIYETWGIKSVK